MKRREIVYLCALSNIFLYRPILAVKAINLTGSAEDIFRMNARDLTLNLGIGVNYISRILDKSELDIAERELEWAEKSGVESIPLTDDKYPKRLKECPDAPLILFYKGTADLNRSRMISIVGTRSASDYGVNTCRDIVHNLSKLSEKPTIISGLAYGIDITAHFTAMECGLETIAVMATGLDRIYPANHRKHAVNIVKKGGLLSDFPSQTTPLAINFLQRNRIIAGLADAVILIESKIKGGGMNTASLANSYSREILALPGRINDEKSAGCNLLISKNIAQSICSSTTIADQLGWSDKNSIKQGSGLTILLTDTSEKSGILRTLFEMGEPLDFDEISTHSKIAVQEVMATLVELEMEGRVIVTKGNRYQLKK